MAEGWTCPTCKNNISPDVHVCPICKQNKTTMESDVPTGLKILHG